MNNFSLVEIIETLQDLPDKVSNEGLFECTVITEKRGNGSARYI
jgi:hypothetical protein